MTCQVSNLSNNALIQPRYLARLQISIPIIVVEQISVKQCAERSARCMRKKAGYRKQRFIDHFRIPNVVYPEKQYRLSEMATNYIVPESMFLPCLRILIPDRAQCNGEIFQGQKGIPTFTDGSQLGSVFCTELGLELYFRLQHHFSVF